LHARPPWSRLRASRERISSASMPRPSILMGYCSESRETLTRRQY
jgi:hypothetical protein